MPIIALSEIALDEIRKDNTPGMTASLAGRVGAASLAPRRILIVSDIRILREGLAEVLAKDSSFSILGIAGGLDDALEVAASEPPHVVLVDAALPEGTHAVTRLRELSGGAQIIVFSVSESEDAVIRWAEAGACGYVPRSAALSELIDFLDCILRGEQICSRRIAAGLFRRIAAGPSNPRRQPEPQSAPTLTSREQEIVQFLAAGCSNKEIARRLNIGLATTKSHVHNVLGKLMLERRGQVSRWMRSNAPSLASGFRDLPTPKEILRRDPKDLARRPSF